MIAPDSAQIVSAYEAGMQLQEIVECFSVDIIAVKACLMQFSKQYQDTIANSETVESDAFNDAEALAARQTIATIMQQSDDDHLRLRAAMYLRNDKKGRLDIKDMGKLKINIGQFNVMLAGANKAIDAAKMVKAVVIPDKERELIEAAQAI